MEEISSHEAPRLDHSTEHCDIGPILEHGILQGRATDFVRNHMFFSAALTPVTIKRYGAEGDFRNFPDYVDLGESDTEKPTIIDLFTFDIDFAVVAEAQIAKCAAGVSS